jgi:spore coat protein H
MRCARPAVALLILLLALPAGAQTSDEFFDGNVLHDIHLVVNSKDWQKLKANFELNTFYPANFMWHGITMRDVAIRSRGFGSRSGVKPGLRIEFDRYRTDQRFLGLRTVVLDNLLQDPSMIRERVSMAFYQRLGWPAPREAHVRLFVNNEYAGLYASIEDVDDVLLERVFGVGQDRIAAEGYLYEYAWRFNYGFTHLGSKLERYEEIFDPKIKAHKSAQELFGPIEDLIRIVNETAEANFARDVGDLIDLRGLMAYLAIENFLADSDGFLGDFGMNNFYVARFEPRRFAPFIPWDKDNAMTADGSRAIAYPIFQRFQDNVLARKAIASPDLRAAYLDALAGAANGATRWMEDEIVRQAALIRVAAHADPFKPYSNQEFEEALAYVLRFARERPGNVRAQVAASR